MYPSDEFLLTHPVWDVTVSGDAFLLTHPVWDVTRLYGRVLVTFCISTHTSRVGCDRNDTGNWHCIKISTHTSRVGCDMQSKIDAYDAVQFLLTHPVWDVTNNRMKPVSELVNFYSHIPCGM